MTPFQPLTNMVYFGSGACYLAGTLCVAAVTSASYPPAALAPNSPPSLVSRGYNWRWHLIFSLILFAVFLTGMGMRRVFASWDARLVQHLLLYPLLIGCMLLSIRIGWQSAWRTWPLQVLMGLSCQHRCLEQE